MSRSINSVQARQILNSRGRPTVEADVMLGDGSMGRASVPSGASTGSAEAHELRDGDPQIYGGLGVLRAVACVNGEISQALLGCDAMDQRALDGLLRELDGTPQLLADEGGLAPGCATGREALEMMMRSIERAVLRPGADLLIAIDVAAASFQQPDGSYWLSREARMADADAMIEMLESWVEHFPVVSIEDGLGEEDWDAWQHLTTRIGARVQLVGDDLFATNPERLARGIKRRASRHAFLLRTSMQIKFRALASQRGDERNRRLTEPRSSALLKNA